MRRLPHHPLPRRRYAPGRGPHPRYSAEPWVPEPEVCPNVRKTWQDPRWLYGLDLFHHDFPWEAHEVLEALWKDLGPQTPEGELVQGVIQLAAARLTGELGRSAARERLLRRGRDRIHRAARRTELPPHVAAEAAACSESA